MPSTLIPLRLSKLFNIWEDTVKNILVIAGLGFRRYFSLGFSEHWEKWKTQAKPKFVSGMQDWHYTCPICLSTPLAHLTYYLFICATKNIVHLGPTITQTVFRCDWKLKECLVIVFICVSVHLSIHNHYVYLCWVNSDFLPAWNILWVHSY